MDNLFLNRMNLWQGIVKKIIHSAIFKDLEEKHPEGSIGYIKKEVIHYVQ
jgi:hypothetical protein